ncbi:MAG: hypothetical protein KDD62_04575 [Bdellovibrionales bacterium]|nr:hypothetical protein [Bdellovibrionales bacterium]
MELLLGLDIGSSAVKASLLDIASGSTISTGVSPQSEMAISSPHPSWAEQDPELWWQHTVAAIQQAVQALPGSTWRVLAIGISYQMHGLVVLDKQGVPLRPAIIWCDSRAVSIGEQALADLGHEIFSTSTLNAPGNFTAAKLAWVKQNEPAIYDQIDCFMLPGDYIAYKLSGTKATTPCGLSEGILWNYSSNEVASIVTKYFGISEELIPPLVPNFAEQGRLSASVASLLGLESGTPISYRAGDQPNNAFSLKVLQPGEIATTAGTSGVVYAVDDKPFVDSKNRVNSFLHVNTRPEALRLGVLFCLNGTGCSYSWLRRLLSGSSDISYETLNAFAAAIEPGAAGLKWYPFGNGAERLLENRAPGARLDGLSFSTHSNKHVVRAVKEGIVFALNQGIRVLEAGGIGLTKMRAGSANMFLSPLFRSMLTAVSNIPLELYNTDGAEGAARAAGIGAQIYVNEEEAFAGLTCVAEVEPDKELSKVYASLFSHWLEGVPR